MLLFNPLMSFGTGPDSGCNPRTGAISHSVQSLNKLSGSLFNAVSSSKAEHGGRQQLPVTLALTWILIVTCLT